MQCPSTPFPSFCLFYELLKDYQKQEEHYFLGCSAAEHCSYR
ncbi:hypothetical protein Patl1_15788 [Pistacia atlantica]|uniref:Uncharacterized protein n=1 Tax=Pistacia atlantica TaxID=434234 RepID=A0ACC1B729_9ROSI|nr:hypothetical protein Patl1_15788 [Pistacia atlantica]